MAYEVTATRKRPQDFDRLVGQEFVVSTLENALKEGRIAHAYLFSGPRGVGKTSSARLLAKALNCEKGMSAHPCGICSSCKEIASGTSVDVIEIDGASNTSVNDIRAIKEEVMFPPQASRYKIYIIDEVHMLSTSAFNALLKTIEEPPEYIIFIFATTELQKVPATIRSRCQQFRFQLIPQDLILSCLKSAAEDLGIKADEDALYWIAKESTGSMRDAYTLFDQVASFSGDHITLDKIRTRLNIAGFDKIKEIASFALAGDNKNALEALSSLYESGVAAEQIAKDGADFFRTLLLYKNGIRRLDLLGAAESDIPTDLIQALSKEQLEAGLKAFMSLYKDMRYTISPRFETELLVSRLSSLPKLASSETLMEKLNELREGIAKGNIVIKKKAQAQSVEINTSKVEKERGKEDKEEIPNHASEEPNTSQNAFQDDKKEITEEPYPSNDDHYIENEEDDAKLTIASIERIKETLRELGMSNATSQLAAVDDVIDNGDGKIDFKMKSRIAYQSIQKDKTSIEKAITAITGDLRKVSFSIDAAKNIAEREPSEKMKALQSLLGGRISFTEIVEQSNIEEKKDELQSIRTSQADGEPRSTDEEDEGGDI